MKMEENNGAESANTCEPRKKTKVNKEEEKKCRRLFNKMSIAKYKSSHQFYSFWLFLQHYVFRDSLDYDCFKIAYTAFMAAECEKIRAWNNNFSSVRMTEKCAEKNVQKDEISKESPTFLSRLFIWITVNGVKTLAFIDSGSFSTNISLSFAKKAGLMKSVDIRSRPFSVGLYPVRVLGTVHSCSIDISGAEYKTQAYIWNEIPGIDVLIGLDFLRLHNCIINLSENRLQHKDNHCVHTEFISYEERRQWRIEYTGHKRSSTEVHKKKLLHIVAMGFEKEAAENALKIALNDIPCAVKYLYCECQKKERLTEKVNNYITPPLPITQNLGQSNHLSAQSIQQVTRKAKRDFSLTINVLEQTLMNLAVADEIQCQQLFENIKKPLTKLEIYLNWPFLHQPLVKFSNDHEKFRQECAIVSSLKQKRIDLMNDRTSAIGRALLTRAKNEKTFENHKKERKEKMLRDYKPSKNFFIRIRVNGFSVLALVDTGSFSSILPVKFAKKTGLLSKMKAWLPTTVQCIGGETRPLGKVSCSFEISNTTFDASCVVFNIMDLIVIGLDFLRRHKCLIDCSTNILTFNGNIRVGTVPDSKIKRWFYGSIVPVNPSFEVDADKLAELVEMEFDKEKATEALTNTLNDLPAAVSTLYHAEARKNMNAIF